MRRTLAGAAVAVAFASVGTSRTATRAAKTPLGKPPPNFVPVHPGACEAEPLERADGGRVLPVAGGNDSLDVRLSAGPKGQPVGAGIGPGADQLLV